MSTAPVARMSLKSHREKSRSPSAMGVGVFRIVSSSPSTFSLRTGSSINISLYGSSSLMSTLAMGLCTRPWKSTPMPTFMPTASRTAETLAMERCTFSHVSMYCISSVPFIFTAVKMNGTEEMQYIDTWEKVQRSIANVSAVRDAVGMNVGIGVDFHGRVHKPMAKVLINELEPYKLMFIEEPVLSENVDGLLDTMRNTPTPIALGERLFSRWDFKAILATGAVDIVQPDPSHAGGITAVSYTHLRAHETRHDLV